MTVRHVHLNITIVRVTVCWHQQLVANVNIRFVRLADLQTGVSTDAQAGFVTLRTHTVVLVPSLSSAV